VTEHQDHLSRGKGDRPIFGVAEWGYKCLVDHTGDLPVARQSRRAQRPNPFYLEGFPAEMTPSLFLPPYFSDTRLYVVHNNS